MSELNPFPNRIADSNLAREMAEAEVPFREVAIRAGEVALGNVKLEMEQRADQASDPVFQEAQAHPVETTQAEDSPEPVEVETSPELSREQLSELAKRCPTRAYSSFDSKGIPRRNNPDHTAGFDALYADTAFGALSTKHWRPNGNKIHELSAQYAAQGVAEGLFLSGSELSTEEDPMASLTYVTFSSHPTSGEPIFPKRDGVGRAGGYLATEIHIQKADYDQLMEAVRADPTTVRELVDAIMQEQIHAGEDWAGSKPPFEDWRASQGGVSRMVIPGKGRPVVEF